MLDLIEEWRKLASQYNDKADQQTNTYTIERLYAQAETLSVCADQLERQISKGE